MRRLVLLFIFILCLNNSIISQSYELKIYDYNFWMTSGGKNICSNRGTHIVITYFDNSKEEIYTGSATSPFSNTNLLSIIRNKRIKNIRFFSFFRRKNGIFCSGNTSGIDVNNNVSNNGYCEYIGSIQGSELGGGSRSSISFKYYIKPLISLIKPTYDLIGYEDNFTVSIASNSTGFNNLVYNWQYQMVSSGSPRTNGWINMPNTTNANGNPSFTVKPIDFLSQGEIGKRLYFRIKTCNGLFSENVIFYKLTRSAPHFQSRDTQNTTCYDEVDGSVTFNFDRDLMSGELLSLSLINTTTNQDFSISNIENDIINRSYTVDGLPTGTYNAQLLGFGIPAYGGQIWNTFVESPTHSTSFTINKPTPIAFSSTYTDVWCHGGSDGEITIIASGGTGSYEYQKDNDEWSSFASGATHTFTNLLPDTYTLKVRDSNGCVAKDIVTDSGGAIIGLGDEIEESITITQPDDPVSITFPTDGHKEPTAFGFSDGFITAKINGGTKLPNNTYNFVWQYFDATTSTWVDWTDFTYAYDGFTKDWVIILQNAKAGNYRLTVTDANYNSATDGQGCIVRQASFSLNQPPLLTLSLAVTNPISCNNANTFGDPWSDGELTATATGGVPFSTLINGEKYLYTWQKKNALGLYEDIFGETSSVLSNLDAGEYAVNITDANGITVGTASGNVITPVDVLYTLTQPKLLEIALSKVDVFCNQGNDGTATVTISGGIPPYDVEWSNGQTETDIATGTSTATNLIAGNTIVFVTDARGCQALGNVTIAQPGGLMIDLVQKIDPTCFGSTDGSIELSLSGGAAPYTYSWNTGATTTSISNLAAGSYTFELTDANACTTFLEIVLENPEEFIIDLGADRNLCQGQSHSLDATLPDADATYSWTADNGFNAANAQINITEAGTYSVIATSSLGCIATDTVVITYTDTAIDSEFLLSSQAYVEDDVILFNVSSPLGDTSEWVIPNNVSIVSQGETSITLRFPEANTYKVGLISTQGDCHQELYKNIVVEAGSGLASPGDTENPFIEAFTVSPNPTNGEFQLYVKLAEVSPIAVRVFTIQGNFIMEQSNIQTAEEYTISMDMNVASGLYFIVLETAQETQIKRVLINQ